MRCNCNGTCGACSSYTPYGMCECCSSASTSSTNGCGCSNGCGCGRNGGCGCNRGCGCRGPMGPMGPIGPMGPQGPQGLPADSRIASFVNTNTGAIATNAGIPLNNDINLDTTDISHVGGATTFSLTEGYYSINYRSGLTTSAAAIQSIALFQNGAVVTKSLTNTLVAVTTSNLSTSFLLSVPTGGSTIEFKNYGAAATTFIDMSVIIEKVAD